MAVVHADQRGHRRLDGSPVTSAAALARISAVRLTADDDVAEVLDIIAAEIRRTDDPSGVAEQCLGLLQQVRDEERS